ncbi:MAG: hypothetical protein AVDCRST_MAG11-588, partial [uncultured Gemmatimonadaceae bacterium]
CSAAPRRPARATRICCARPPPRVVRMLSAQGASRAAGPL